MTTPTAARGAVTLHIGMPKTGTTSLQRTLAGNRDDIDAAGFWYPDLKELAPHARSVSQWDLIDWAVDGAHQDVVRAWQQARQARGGGVHTIISAENAWLRLAADPSALPRLVETLGGDVVVLAYVRRQSDYALSWFNQRMRTHVVTGADLEDAFLRFLPTIDHIDLAAVLGNAVASVGRSNVVVRPYVRRELVGGDLVADALQTIGLPPLQNPGDDDNASASITALTAKLAVNRLPGIEADQASRVMRLLREVDPEMWGRRDEGEPTALPTLDALDVAHEDGNRWVARTFLDREELFPGGGPTLVPNWSAVDPAEVAGLLAAAVHSLAEAEHQRRLEQQRRRAAQRQKPSD